MVAQAPMYDLIERVQKAFLAEIEGQVHRVLGLTAESRGLFAPVGGRCEIYCRDGTRLPAEVIGFRQEHAVVAPYGDIRGMSAGDRIVYRGASASVPVGPELIGRVIDSGGELLDAGPPLSDRTETALHKKPLNPLARTRIRDRLVTGVRSIDGLLSVGRGQRMGIFSGTGVGKSVLLGMIARGSDADVIVIGLVGERSREVREFLDVDLGDEGRKRAVVVVASSEEPALKRIQAAFVATAIAEAFRDAGKDVLLLMDSLSRVATAQRELGLSCGEPPATKGYPPSVFAVMPRILERAGPTEQGSITGFYSVLVEADDRNDPVADCARGVLDGHLWLSRDLAERGLFPAVDPLLSLSRVQPNVVSPQHLAAATTVRGHLARYQEVEELLRLGAYSRGNDARVDASVNLYPAIESFLRQPKDEVCDFDDTVALLQKLVEEDDHDTLGRSRAVRTSGMTDGGRR